METLDNILSGKGEAAPEPEKQEPPVAQAEVAEKPAAEVTEQQDEVIEQDGRKMVPLEALTETRGKVKRYTEQVADFERRFKESDAAWERRLKESDAAWERRLAQFMPRQAETPAPEWFDNPDAALGHRLKPFESQFQAFESQIQQVGRTSTLLSSKALAIASYGKEAVAEMEAAVQAAMQAGDPEIATLQQQLQRSSDPVSVAMDWYRKRPEVQRKEHEAELIAAGWTPPQTLAAKPQTVQTTVMPTALEAARNVGSRSGPAWAGPRPLEDIFKR